MGEGGVACAPSQHIMERFPIPESLCGGKGVLASNPFRAEKNARNGEKKDDAESKGETGSEKGMKLDKRLRKGELEKGELVLEKPRKGELEEGEFHNGELEKEEHRNGELEKGEFVPKKWRKSEVEVGERRRRDEVEQGEISDRRSRGGLERGGFAPDKSKRAAEPAKSQSQSTRGRKVDLEKSDVPERTRRHDRDYSPEGNRRRTDGRLSDADTRKRSSSSRWDGSLFDRDAKKCSRVSEIELGVVKHDNNNEKNRDKEPNSGKWLKWQSSESESSNRRHHSNLPDHSGSKNHRKSEDVNRSANQERSRRTESSSATKVLSSSKHSSSRLSDPSFSSGVSHDKQGRSPGPSEQSPKEHTHHSDHRDHSPRRSMRSPREKSRHSDHRDHTPNRSNRSPHQRPRHHDHWDRDPMHLDRSPHSTRHSADHRDSGKKNRVSEKHQSSRNDDRLGRKEYSDKDNSKNKSSKSSCDRSSVDKFNKEKLLHNSSMLSGETPPPPPPPLPPPPPPPPALPPPPPPTPGVFEDPSSMEEDMDISDTPPREPIMSDFDAGKWFYLDHFGIEQGPSKLVDLKRLVDEGILLSDHLIKHADSDRWVTVENAASPLVPLNFPSVVSDVVTQMVSPPEAPGNLLVDAGALCQETSSSTFLQQDSLIDGSSFIPEHLDDYHIDERVETLLDGYTIVDGKELEIIGEALNATFEHADWEKWGQSEGFSRFKAQSPYIQPRDEGVGRYFESFSTDCSETRPVFGPSEKDHVIAGGGYSEWFAGRWSCKGGDWKRNDEVGQDRSYRRKLVINEGYPLCQMPKSGYEDPRCQRKDDLYYPSRNKRLDLPMWSFSSVEDTSDSGTDPSTVTNRSAQTKPLALRGLKGTILPVVRINACVVKDQASSEPSMKVRSSSERHPSRSSRSLSSSDRASLHEGSSRSKKLQEHDLQVLQRCQGVLNVPKDRICTMDDLSTDLGDWFYLDGAGCEHGPFAFSELQELVGKGTILEHSSVFRKIDNTWLPITKKLRSSETVNNEDDARASTGRLSSSSLVLSSLSAISSVSHPFHSSHPQFLGYTRGKLHELVMRSYKNREFAAAINEVLDPWISAKQPKKEIDKHFPFNSSITKSSAVLAHDLSGDNIWKPEDGMYRDGKRARLLLGDSDEDSEMEDSLLPDYSFEDLCSEVNMFENHATTSEPDTGSWGLLNSRLLARIFHFLKIDSKSLACSAATCKHWNASVNFYRSICRHVDLSSAGLKCTDAILHSSMGNYGKKNLTSLGLMGCLNISANVLEEVLQQCPQMSYVDVRGCNQFKELQVKYPNIKWIKRSGLAKPKNLEESHSKIRSLRQITESNYLMSRTYKALSSYLDDSDDLGNFSISESKSLDRKSFSSHQFKQGFYKRPKLYDARRSSELLSRDAQMRRWLHRKSENSYRKMEEFVAYSLRNITRGSKSEFFMSKIAKIEDRMRCGYYVRHGLNSIKDDISRMCQDAFKSKSRNDAGDMKKIIMSFIQLIKRLDNPRLIPGSDEMVKAGKENSDTGSYVFESKYKKKQGKALNEKKGIHRSINTSYANGGTDYRAYAFDREIKRSLSKLKKRQMDSDSETSEDHENDLSEEDDRGEGESSTSDTESDMEVQSGSGTWDLRDESSKLEESMESVVIDDREWGARMTKAGLVPPVTRKYEVIDKYLIVADEEEVRRKMRVALPDDYSEKLLAQKSGIEDSDMEIPEVKDYKPRKSLGDEVIEQEVYGIDPYTHNLLLDSMPDEPDWPLADRHKFIEEMLLSTLNKQVRRYTGSGNTPMVYSLRPVIEEIQKNAEDAGDKRTVRMCHAILKAMRNRPDDNYVAYRKGLGVVCNKHEGFEQDDFVVEFLGEVYPAWKWFEKQDGIRSLQKNSQEPAPEFYNIYLERPKGDRDGYDLVVVDAMHKANYASRICHSCRPNCEAKVTAVDGQYQIGIYSLVPISYGEEITFDYNSVTESKEEYEASVCLCGSQVCRGSFLNLAGEGAFEKVLKEGHGVLDRHKLMLEACDANFVSQDDYIDLGRAGLGSCLLDGLPDWLVAYSAHLVRFINFERTKLPDEILKHNLEEKRKFFSDICLDVEKNDAEIQAEGVYNARLQNIALTLDKVRYVMSRVFGDPKKAPPPIERLTGEGMVSVLWKGEGSLVEDLLHSMAPHVDADLLSDVKSKIQAHDPSGSDNIECEIRKSLLWLRDELRSLPCNEKCRHDAAADLIHIYAYTKVFFKIREYKSVTSLPVYISPLDLGPKLAEKIGSGFQEYCKTYRENYCLGQLIYWYSQMNADPDCRLARARKGCLSLPDISSFYAKNLKPLRENMYTLRTVRFMMSRMEKDPQRPWPKDRIWVFPSNPKFFGSPMMDAVLNKCPLDKEMMHWLKTRPAVF